MPAGVTMYGYADDGALVVEADTRGCVESRTNAALATAIEWGSRNKLRFSVEKTEAIQLKGPHKRSPNIRMNGARVRFSPSVKYLGVILDRKLNFCAHVNHVA